MAALLLPVTRARCHSSTGAGEVAAVVVVGRLFVGYARNHFPTLVGLPATCDGHIQCTHEAALQRVRLTHSSSSSSSSTSSSSTTATFTSTSSSRTTTTSSSASSSSSSSSSSSAEPKKKKQRRCGSAKRRHYTYKTKWVSLQSADISAFVCFIFLIFVYHVSCCSLQAVIQAFLQGGQSALMRKKVCKATTLRRACWVLGWANKTRSKPKLLRRR
jgi:hypothetical protein